MDRETALLLPPDLRDWVPADHLVHFVIDAVEQLDVGTARVNDRGTGSEQYPPRMLPGLLIYSYATGVFSSRQIERAAHENAALLGACFAQVLELAAGCGVLKVGGITVAHRISRGLVGPESSSH